MRGVCKQAERYFQSGTRFPASELRKMANSVATVVSQSLSQDARGPGVDKPFAEDPREMAESLKRLGCAPYPPQQQYAAGSRSVPGGQLSRISAAGLLEGHRFHCSSCREGFDPSCYIHTLCTMLEHGVRLPFTERPDRPRHELPRPLWRLDSPDPEEAERAKTAVDTFEKWKTFGAIEGPLTLEQIADPDYCFYISHVDMAPRSIPVLGSALKQAAAERNMPNIAREADLEAALFVERYRSACNDAIHAGKRPDCAAIFSDLARSLRVNVKYRPVVHLHRTVNWDMHPTSITFSSPFDLLGAAQQGDAIAISDGKSAYNQVPVAACDRKYLCVRHPVDGGIYRYNTITMGLGPAVTIFSAIKAETKKILAEGPAKRQGGITVSGIIDDIGETMRQRARVPQQQFRDSVYDLICYTAEPAKSNDDVPDATRGRYRGLDFDTNTLEVQINHDKVADTARMAAIFRRLPRTDFPFAPVGAFESFVGSMGWLAFCNPQLSLHCRGLYRALFMAKDGNYSTVNLGREGAPRPPGRDDLDWLWERVRSNRLSGQRKLLGAAAAVVTTTTFASGRLSPDERALRQAALGEEASGSVAAHLSDASVGSDGVRRWGSISGDVVTWHEVPAGSPLARAWADEIELEPIAVNFERNGENYRGKLVVIYTDNIGNTFRINRGSAAYDSAALGLLDRIYEAAERHGFDFVCLWVPRAFNQLADLISDRRDEEEVRAWAAANGLQFRKH